MLQLFVERKLGLDMIGIHNLERLGNVVSALHLFGLACEVSELYLHSKRPTALSYDGAVYLKFVVFEQVRSVVEAVSTESAE